MDAKHFFPKVNLECEHFWRTIPELKANPKKIEDVDTDLEDHVYDEVRYACMQRPIRPSVKQLPTPVGSFAYERKKYIQAKKYADRYGTSIVSAYHNTRR